jgi:predicted ATPase/DNA-binding CsgD family transcriptional regulator
MPSTTLPGDDRAQPVSDAPVADRVRGLPSMPVYLTTFIGRERQIAQAIDLMQREEVRLLTLTGPGGIGKTRLAIHLAGELGRDFSGGICFVRLSTVTNPELVLQTIARAVEIPEIGGRSLLDALKGSLRDRRFLLILDNFEQVIDAATYLTDLLAHCPFLKVIVTSRVVLRVQGEQELAVPPLATPARGPGRTWNAAPLDELTTYDAINLFLQRAQSVQSTFTLTDDNALAVAEICTRLDGLPLAIELAAARIKILTPSALLTRLTNRLQVLTGGARDQPERLRTMRNAIAWSYELLEPDEQLLFQSLSVFAGGFTLEAAESVINGLGLPIDTLDGVASLVDSSLLREIDLPDDERRFLMLATIREYGLEQLATSHMEEIARRRHAEWCVSLAERAEPELTRANVVSWLNRLEREHDNVRSALSWLLEQGDIEAGLQIISGVWMFWFFRCYFREARGWLDRILEQMPDTPTPIRARIFVIAALFTEAVGDFAEANEKLEAGRRIATDLDEKLTLGMIMLCLGDVADNTGHYEQAEQYLWTAAELFRATNEQIWLVLTLAFLGSLTQRRGDEEQAQSLTYEALALARQIGFPWGTAISLNRLGRLARNRADNAQAANWFKESLAIWRELGDHWRISRSLIDLADVASADHHYEHAARLLGAAHGINESIGASESFVDDSARQRAMKLASEQLDAETFAERWATGQMMSWEEAVALAIESPTVDRKTMEAPGDAAETHGLTGREMEVLRLLAVGHSDRQIAEELYISRRTAQGHVANIFNKLGVNSRTAAATAALRAGLVDPEPSLP